MRKYTLKDILLTIQRTIDSVDNRLTNHGEQVGYLCLHMGRELGYSDEQLTELTALAMVHDIGAYKVEERRKMIEFEITSPHEHAVYGYLFLREFSPLAHLAKVILYHHWRFDRRRFALPGMPVPDESLLIHLADRVSVLFAHYGNRIKSEITGRISPIAGTIFHPRYARLLENLTQQTDIIDKLMDGSYLEEIYSFLEKSPINSEQANSYLAMLVQAIDFRSRQTVTHSVSVVSAAVQIAELVGLSPDEKNMIEVAALLHDVGKMTTPIEILSKPGKLTDEEMRIMQSHVRMTEEILLGAGLNDINRIASYHHERPNGRGYHRGASGAEISREARILAIADRLAALVEPRYYKSALSKQEVLGIMDNAAEVNDIDARIYAVIPEHYDPITANMRSKQKEMLRLYEQITSEYTALLRDIYGARNTEQSNNRLAA